MGRLFDRERLARLRQKQENAFTPIFLHRPLAILFLLPTADIAWITPNRITTVSIVMRLVVAGLLWPYVWGGPPESTAMLVLAIALWHAGCVLDAADGALARYRGQSSRFGRYFDKVSDRLITLVLVMVLVARACVSTGEPHFGLLGLVYVGLLSATSVSKWIELGVRVGLGPQESDDVAKDRAERPAPKRSASAWAAYLARSLGWAFVVSEMDLPLWGSIALIFGREDLLLWYLAVFSIPYALWAMSRRGYLLWRDEQTR